MALTVQDATTVSVRTIITSIASLLVAHGIANKSNAELIASIAVILGMWGWGLVTRHLNDKQKKELEQVVDVARQMPPGTLSDIKGVLERTGSEAANVDMLKGVSANAAAPVPASVARTPVVQ